MKKIILTMVLALAFCGSFFAQETHWPEVNLYNYGDNYPSVAFVQFDGDYVTSENYTNFEIAAFVDDECRGHMFMDDYTDDGDPYPIVEISIYYTNPGETVTFQMFDHSTGVLYENCTLNMEVKTGEPHVELYFDYEDALVIAFEAIEPQDMYFIGQGDWNDLEKWQDLDRLPTNLDNVIIAEGAICYMPASAVGHYSSLTIEDGAQLYAPEDAEVIATVKKNIEGYDPVAMNNWYLISFPVNIEEPDFEGAGMFNNGDYDLFYFDQNYPGTLDENPANGEWRNFKWYMENGMEFKAPYNGYLYANRQNTTLEFTGELYTAGDISYQRIPLVDGSDENAQGVNLIGNPYTCNAEMETGSRITGIYMMNDERTDVIVYDDGDFDYTVVAPMTSFFAVTSANHAQGRITMSPVNLEDHDEYEEPWIIRSNVSTMSIELTANGVLKDRMYVKTGEGENCIKFNLSNNGSKIFVSQNDKNYAIAYAEDANVMPMCFTTKESGTYTLSFNTKNMNCGYLHLIDNATGVDIDLLQTPSYTFDSKDSNYANRFKIVFSEEATNEIPDSFAFISNGELMINNNGEATLQVIDITGRILSSERIQGCYSKSLNLNAGVYMIRLINGNDVKTQKMVVE